MVGAKLSGPNIFFPKFLRPVSAQRETRVITNLESAPLAQSTVSRSMLTSSLPSIKVEHVPLAQSTVSKSMVTSSQPSTTVDLSTILVTGSSGRASRPISRAASSELSYGSIEMPTSSIEMPRSSSMEGMQPPPSSGSVTKTTNVPLGQFNVASSGSSQPFPTTTNHLGQFKVAQLAPKTVPLAQHSPSGAGTSVPLMQLSPAEMARMKEALSAESGSRADSVDLLPRALAAPSELKEAADDTIDGFMC